MPGMPERPDLFPRAVSSATVVATAGLLTAHEKAGPSWTDGPASRTGTFPFPPPRDADAWTRPAFLVQFSYRGLLDAASQRSLGLAEAEEFSVAEADSDAALGVDGDAPADRLGRRAAGSRVVGPAGFRATRSHSTRHPCPWRPSGRNVRHRRLVVDGDGLPTRD